VGDQLLALLGRLARERFGDGPIDPSLPMFLTPEGQRIDVDSFRKYIWTPALVKAGLSYRKPYSLRHTYATLLLSQGQSVRYIKGELVTHHGSECKVMTNFPVYEQQIALNACWDLIGGNNLLPGTISAAIPLPEGSLDRQSG
jgi:hypothetical protein